jgi:MFS family permease
MGAAQPWLAGLGIATATLSSALTSLFALRAVRKRLSTLSTLAVSFVAIAAGFMLVGGAGQIGVVFFGLALAGVGLGMQMPVMASWLQGAVSPQVRGRAMGGYTTAVFLGQFASPFIHGPSAAMAGYGGNFMLTAGLCMALAGLLAVLLRRG